MEKPVRSRLIALTCRAWLLTSAVVFGGADAARAQDASMICDHAAAVAASQSGVPISVLKAISLTETGRAKNGAMRPWPWTVNMEGKGVWFETEDDARAYVYQHYKRGARSFDVGCFQLNYKWHHQEFASIEEMFDPIKSGEYAAAFLTKLFEETGSWEQAAGTYHSRTPEYSTAYQKKFTEFRQGLLSEDSKPIDVRAYQVAATTPKPLPVQETARQTPTRKPRVNTFPLLQKQDGGPVRGSLVPLGGVSVRGDFIDFGAS